MTTVVERPADSGRSGGARRGGSSGFPHLPQVNLLPPEVRSARALRAVKVWLALVVVAALVLIGLAYGYATIEEGAAQSDLDRANADTQDLHTEQRTYADVPVVLGQLQTLEAARILGSSTEVMWEDYVGAVSAVTPPGVTIESIGYGGANPMTSADVADVLVEDSMGVITFAGRAPTTLETAAWMDALDSIPGLSNAWISTEEIDGTDTVSYYKITGRVNVTSAALALRFLAPVAGGEDE